ncbi:hypothetical protein LO763_06125 [Glycomyces sp. A-F 0318]|uniref:hypothetical protein n=1 Tax=Glycomyces amatae TaxID=2881355 RepID=UPI001E40AA14|nr:hypothetical protein [Glycomyces amatae]MCD0443204.1 hypothetical protein [Glycomyces amatae]
MIRRRRRSRPDRRRRFGTVLLAAAALVFAAAIGFADRVGGVPLILAGAIALTLAIKGLASRRTDAAPSWPAAMDRPRYRTKALAATASRSGGTPDRLRNPAVLRLLDAADDGDRARTALDGLLASGPRAWAAFDDDVRTWTMYRSDRIDVIDAGAPVPETPLGLALAMSAADGRRRAEALPHVVEHPQLYPLVLLRAVDHVAPIRELALELLPRLLAAGDHETFGAVLTLAHRLRKRMRAAPMFDLVLTALSDLPDGDLLAVLAAADGRSARWAGEALIGRGRLDAPLLEAIATGRFGDRLQERCAEALADHASARDRPDLLRPLLTARSARVRTAALTALVRVARFDGVEDLLTDRSAPVRATAQWGLRRAGRDPAAHYRALLQIPQSAPRPVIQGLGDCGRPEDADLIEPYLEDPRPKTRAAAVTAFKNLRVDRDLSRLLLDPAPVVARAAADHLADRRLLPPVAALRELVERPHPAHTRRAAVALLRAHGIWHRIWADLALYDDVDQPLSFVGLTGLDLLCRHRTASITAPLDDRLRDEIRALMRARSDTLYLDTRQTLDWLLETARPGRPDTASSANGRGADR